MKVRKQTRGGRNRRSDSADAFLTDPDGGPTRANDELAQELGEEFLMAATSGDYVAEDRHEREVPEECGGPFIIHSASSEFGRDVDASNPIDGSREALPSPMRAR